MRQERQAGEGTPGPDLQLNQFSGNAESLQSLAWDQGTGSQHWLNRVVLAPETLGRKWDG